MHLLTVLLDEAKDLKIVEKRCSTDEYAEIVIDNAELPQWETILAAHMGEPASPVGARPKDDELALTKEYGGIWKDQVLYKRLNDDGSIIIAILRPWGNALFTTLKIAFIS